MKAGSAFTAPCVTVDSTERANMQAKKAGIFSEAGNLAGMGKASGRSCVRVFVSAHGLRTPLKARKRRFYAGLRRPAHSAHRTCAPPRMRLLAPRYAWYFFSSLFSYKYNQE